MPETRMCQWDNLKEKTEEPRAKSIPLQKLASRGSDSDPTRATQTPLKDNTYISLATVCLTQAIRTSTQIPGRGTLGDTKIL